MPANRSKRHRHKYHLVVYGAGHVWACAQPDCTHYMPSNMSGMVEGKASICWQCGGDMILDHTNMEERKPRCENCRLGIVEEMPISPAMAERLVIKEVIPDTKPKVILSEDAILAFLNK